jgi:integrase
MLKGEPTMRRTGHIRQRAPGSFELRYSIGVDPATGRRRIATATVKGSRRDAEKELRRLLRQVDTGEHAAAGNKLTVGAWLSQWLASVRETLAPQSHDRYSEIVTNHLIPGLGDVPLARLTESHITTFYSSLERKDGKGAMAPRTRRQLHRVLSSALRRAVEDRMISRNPTDMFRKRMPKVEKVEMKVLTAAQSRQLLDAARDTPLYGPVLLALATGARRGECLALRWRNVDLEAGTVLIAESLEQRRGVPIRSKAPKGEKQRSIALPAFAVDALRGLKLRQVEQMFALGVRVEGDTLVCMHPDGKTPSPAAITNAFARLVARLSGMPAIRFHSLRHGHATALLLAGVHPKIAQERLGHSSVAMTMDLYSHVTSEMQRDAADKLDKAFR